MNDKELESIIKNAFTHRVEENPFRQQIDDLIVNLNKKRKIRKKLLMIIPILLTSTTVLAITYNTFNLSSVGIDEKTIEEAISNGYIQIINSDYQRFNGLGIKIDKFLIDDINFIMSLNFEINNIDINTIENIYINNINIYDENNNLIFDSNNNQTETKSIGYTKIEKTSDSTFNNTFFAMSNNYSNSQKIYIKFNNVSLHCKHFDKNIAGTWRFEIDVSNQMVNRTEDIYRCNSDNVIDDIILGSIKVTNTGTILDISSPNEESLNNLKITLKVSNTKYKASDNMFDIVSNNNPKKIIRFIPFSLNKYDEIDKIIVEIKNENQRKEFVFEKE